jgi:flagellar motor switch/type III secretory pathway protein FliN
VKVAPFNLRSRPSVATHEAAATRSALAIIAGLPPTWQVDLPPFGAAAVTIAGIVAGGERDDTIDICIARGGEAGRLAVSVAFASRIVDAALGTPANFSSARGLGPAERGVLIGILSPLLDATGWSLLLRPSRPMTSTAAPIALAVRTPIGGGLAWLDLPATARAPEPLWRPRAAYLSIDARVELAATDIAAQAWAEVAPGDAVVFDGVAPFVPGNPREMLLAIGWFRAPARLEDGHLALTGEFQRAGVPIEATAILHEEKAMEGSVPKTSAVLAGAPVEVVAELARIRLRGDEVLGLAPGAVVTMAPLEQQTVLLRAGDEPWAEGELVNVDGALGVRVTRLLRPDG